MHQQMKQLGLCALLFGCSQSEVLPTNLDMSADLASPADMTGGEPGGEFTTLRLIAGQLGGQGNLDAVGANARFSSPYGVVLDGAGQLFISDNSNFTIRRAVLATGAVSTLAGSAGQMGSIDGLNATARLSTPRGMAFDGGNGLYVADNLNYTIRKIDLATGAVTTLAGTAGQMGSSDGVGRFARFGSIDSLVFDGAGSLYVTDTGNHTIRKIVVNTGAVSTYAGMVGSAGVKDGMGLAAQFSRPSGIAFDGTGNLYVSDGGGATVRRVVLSTAMVSTVAGLANMSGSVDGVGTAARFGTPAGLALDGAGNLYVADSGSHTVRKVVLATAMVSTLAGTAAQRGSTDAVGSAARFSVPYGLAADGAGSLYVADYNSDAIRKINLATAAVSTPLGMPGQRGNVDGIGTAALFATPLGITADTAGNAYIADNGTIRKVVIATGSVTTIAGTAGVVATRDGIGSAAAFALPHGLAWDPAGYLYVAEAGGHTIRKVTLATGVVSTFAGAAGMEASADGVGPAARFASPREMVLDGAGALYVADTRNQTIRKIVLATATVTTLAGSAGLAGNGDGVGGAARFSNPIGLAFAPAGVLYVTDGGNCLIRKIEVSTRLVSTVAGAAPCMGAGRDGLGSQALFTDPSSLTIDARGNLYVTEGIDSTIRLVEPANGQVRTLVGRSKERGVILGPLPASINFPRAVTALPSGGLALISENALLHVR